MTRPKSRWINQAAALVLAMGLAVSPAARAQEEESSDSKGRPFDGYMATFVLAGLALFVVAKTARR